jgi:hypothetical protein
VNKLELPEIIIVGLRRSGTTAFWEAFRLDTDLCCYDEPFNPNLSELPEDNSKGTRSEFISLYKSSHKTFEKYFSPIHPLEETAPILKPEQKKYLKWLLSNNQQRKGLVVDSVRLNFKLKEVLEICPDAIIVHLHRRPAAWISSHMFPSGKGTWRRTLADIYRKISFWRRKGLYNNWNYQEIIEREISDASCWDPVNINAADLISSTAVQRLFAFWNLSFIEVEKKGSDCWGDRFISISFEDFCANPKDVISKVYKLADIECPDVDYSDIHSANLGYRPNSEKWDTVLNSAFRKEWQ